MNSWDLSQRMWHKRVKAKKFPFSISETVGVFRFARNLHWHNEMEICYIRQGTGKYLINGRQFDFEAGDMFVINSNQVHLAYDNIDLVMQVTMFDPSLIWSGGSYQTDYESLKPFMETGKNFCNKLDRNNVHISELVNILMEIEQEYVSGQEGYETMIKSLLLRFLTILLRYFRNEETMDNDDRINLLSLNSLKDAIDCIEQFYFRPLTLPELAKISNMSVSHFSHMFKVFAGTSPMEYIIQKRVMAAKEILKTTDKKIVEVAAECGFNTLSNFNKCFKSYVGISPKQYRMS